MLYSAVALFAIGLLAALFGFGGISALAVDVAQVLFVLFAVLAVGNFLVGLRRGADRVADR